MSAGPPAPLPGNETVGFRRRREKRAVAEAFLAGKPLLVGLDLAKKRHAAWIAGRDLIPIRRFMVPHSHEGLEKLLERAELDRAATSSDRVLVFMEPTSHFWENVANFLEAREVAYRLVSPLAVCREREIEHITYAKGDYRDAELIVNLGASGQWTHRLLEKEPLWIELRALADEHECLLKAEVRERQRVRSLLELAVPETLECFDDPLGKTARALLKQLSRPATAIPRTFADLVNRVAAIRGVRLARSKLSALAARLRAAPNFGVERALASSLARIGLSVERFETTSAQREEVRSRLVALYRSTPYHGILDTIPGVSPESQALILGMIGDPKQYDRATCLIKLAGTEPRENHSGNAEGRHSISHRGRPSLRFILHRVALGFRRGNPEFNAYVERLRNRERNPLAWREAAVAAGNKYLRLVHRMCVESRPYDRSKLVSRTQAIGASPQASREHPELSQGDAPPRSSNEGGRR